jgi:signal transduction histidine kinase
MLSLRPLNIEAPKEPVQAEVDTERFQIVVRNLISNAIKYSADSKPITVLVERNGGTARVKVVDHGIGIAPDDQARLFTQFGRIERESTMHVAGTGLGLWLSREIARLHDGDITVDSTEGEGSTFTFEVPIIA